MNNNLVKSDLIQIMADKQGHFLFKDVEDSVHCILDHMAEALADGERVEIRGFGAFSLHKRRARIARNPKTGEPVHLSEKYVPYFKPGKALRYKVNPEG